MVLETLFSIALFITGGHVMDSKFGLHHYSDEDYKEIFCLTRTHIHCLPTLNS